MPTDDPAVCVLRRFRLVFNAVKSHFRQVESQTGIGGAQLWALSVIAERPDIGMKELANAMDIHQSTASNLVRSLAAQDLLGTAREGQDKRSVQLRLRPAGRQLLSRAPAPFSGVLPDALAALDAETLERLDRDLSALNSALQADPLASRTPLSQM